MELPWEGIPNTSVLLCSREMGCRGNTSLPPRCPSGIAQRTAGGPWRFRRGRPSPLLGAVVPLWFSDWFLTLGLMRSRNSPIISQGSVRSSDRACRDPGVGDGIRRCSWEGSATLPLTHVIYGLSPPSHTPIPSCSIQSRSHPAGLIPPIPGTSQSRDTSIPAEAAEGRKEEQQLQGCARPGFLVGTRQGCPGASPAQETFPRWNLAPELPIHFNYKTQHPECQTRLFAAERWN